MDVVLLQAEMNKVKEEAITKIERDSGTHNGVITCRHQTFDFGEKGNVLESAAANGNIWFFGSHSKNAIKDRGNS